MNTELENALGELKDSLFKRVEQEIDKKAGASSEIQRQVDQLSTTVKRQKRFGYVGGNSFETELAEGIAQNHDAIRNLRKGQSVSFQMKAVGDMTFGSNFSTADASITDVKPSIVMSPNRKVHIRQLLPMGTMTGSNFDFVAENGGEGDLSTVSEGSQKPQFDVDLIEKQVSAQYIAGWLRISRKMLDDVTAMTSFLQQRLLEKYLKAEDNQLLYGNGTSPNIEGIVTSATDATSTAENDYGLLLDAFSALEGDDYGVSAILINPADYYKIAQYQATGSGEYDKPGIVQFVNGGLFFDGVPVYKSTAITSGSYLIGDFQRGAQLLQREAPRIEFFEQDGSNVQKNMITVRVEGRIALPIFHPDAFIKGDFTSATT